MKFEPVPLAELKTKIPAELLPMVDELKGYLAGLANDQGGRITLDDDEDPGKVKKALKAAAASLYKGVRFPFRGERSAVSFYLEEARKRRGRPKKVEAEGTLAFPKSGAKPVKPGAKRRGRPRKAEVGSEEE
ncbi:MAG: hypothetical protein HYY96_01835 [Candidatus Tectomicrobia bacterium]|nr:hypothetical protein [Candidatus Tectomicrobia bacterium]